MIYPTWKALWEAMEKAPAPPSCEDKHRASSLPAKMSCIKYISEGGSYHATRGRALHHIMEEGPEAIPFDIPDDEEHQIKIAFGALNALLEDGWEVVDKEVPLQNNRVTCNMDILFERNGDLLYIDWKFGQGLVDSSSPQLACGAELIYDNMEVDTVYTGIVQPFFLEMSGSMAIRKWTRAQAQDKVSEAIAYKMNISKYCGYCDHNTTCSEISLAAKHFKEYQK